MALNERPKKPGTLWRYGHGAPTSIIGGENDFYRDVDTGLDYQKFGGSWGLVFQAQLPATKITGTIVDAQIATVSGSKITGSITTATIPAANVTGGPAWTYGTSFPGSPTDGDKHTLVDSTTNPTYQWTFRYNNGSSSSFKWEFVGGTPVIVKDTSGTNRQNTVSNTFQFITGMPSFTVPRAGQYQYKWSCDLELTNVNDQVYLDIGKTNITGLFGAERFHYQSDIASRWYTYSDVYSDLLQGISRAASDTIGLLMDTVNSVGNVAVAYGAIEILPQRCS